MALINDKDRELLRNEFSKLTQPVRLVLFLDTEDCSYCTETKQLMEEIVSLSPQLALESYNVRLDKEKAEEFKIDKVPATVVMNGKDYGIRYFGIPAGYEFGSLIDDILDVSRGESGLAPATKAGLMKLSQPLHFQVFVTPT